MGGDARGEGDAPAGPLSLPSAANHAGLGRCLPLARLDYLAYRIHVVRRNEPPANEVEWARTDRRELI